MSSEDDYFVDLYERHAERKGRRARRRGSGGSGQKADNRNGSGKSSRRSRRPRVWLIRRSIRVAGIFFVVLLAIYEFNLLMGSESKRSPSSRTDRLFESAADAGTPKAKKRSPVAVEVRKSNSTSGSGAKAASPPAKKPPSDEKPPPAAVEKSIPEKKVETSEKEIDTSGGADAPADAPSASKEKKAPPPPAAVETTTRPPPPPPPPTTERPRTTKAQVVAPKAPESIKGGKSESGSGKSEDDKSSSGGGKSDDLDDSAADSAPDISSVRGPSKKAKKKKAASDEDGGADDEEKPAPKKSAAGGGKPPAGAPGNGTDGGGAGAQPGENENFWKWFQDSKGSEGDKASAIECPKAHERLCQMFYKYLRKHKIRSIFDASCGKNLDWIKIPLHKVGNELWGFKYYCGEPNEEKMAVAKEALKEFGFVEFDDRQWWRAGFPEGVELLFAWDVLAHTAFGRVWSFFVNVRKQDIKWILVDNYPAIMNDPSPKREFINLRKHPFRFPAPSAVVQDVREPGESEDIKRQLLLYEGSQLPDNLA